jgi:hypothetical protein
MRLHNVTSVGFAFLLVSMSASAAPDDLSLKISEEVKRYIFKNAYDQAADFAKLHKICGKPWNKGCRFWKSNGSKDKFEFQVRTTGPRGKIYGIPSMFVKSK